MSSQTSVSRSPQAIMETPWPKRAEHLFLEGMPDLPPEEMERLQSENRFAQEEEGRMRRELLNAKSVVCPSFSVLLTSRDPTVTDGKLRISIKLRYNRSREDALPVILHNPSAQFGEMRYGAYQVFSNSSCDASSQLAFHKIYVTMRRARDRDGRFLPLPAEKPISEQNGWLEMKPGDEEECEAVIDFCSNQGWKSSLRAGEDYWLKYGVPGGMSVGRAEIASWRFGTMDDWRGKVANGRDSTYIAIPLGPSNALKFHVDSIDRG